jgi:hypothetical protein
MKVDHGVHVNVYNLATILRSFSPIEHTAFMVPKPDLIPIHDGPKAISFFEIHEFYHFPLEALVNSLRLHHSS